MSWEDDILETCRDLIRRSKTVVCYAGTVSEVTTSPVEVSVIVEGASAPTPCIPLNHNVWVAGQRVVIVKAGEAWYVVGVLGFQSVLRAPQHTGTHPTGTTPGDVWYRSDLNHFYGNVNGTPTQLDN